MPGLQNSNNNTIRAWKKEKNGLLTMKNRLIYSDPDTTDLSSEDEFKSSSLKISIEEIHIPLNSSSGRMIQYKPTSKSISKRKSKMPNKKNRALCNSGTKVMSAERCKYRGVRRRRWGKWVPEIRDPSGGLKL